MFGGSGGERGKTMEEDEEEKEGVLLRAEGHMSVMLKDPDNEGASTLVASSYLSGWLPDIPACPSSCPPLAWTSPVAPSSVGAV